MATEEAKLSNWPKVTLFVNGKNWDANPSVPCLPEKCDLCAASKAAHCLPRQSLHVSKLHATKCIEAALVAAKIKTFLLGLPVQPDGSVPHFCVHCHKLIQSLPE